MEDLIERKAAIDAAKRVLGDYEISRTMQTALHILPSAQPETHEERTETHACDLISREAAIDALRTCYDTETVTMDDGDEYINYGDAIGEIEQLPSAQPEQTNSWYINSWCNNCKEYDTENKCCPRYNRVIKQTLDEAYRHGETEAEARFHDEIVRCKDCKWKQGSECVRFAEVRPFPDDFCSRAERRTDGN